MYKSSGKRKLIIVSGPSGAGKSTIVRALLSKNLRLKFSVSATTRSPRKLEKEGKDYYFLKKETFEEFIKKEAFVEYEMVYQGIYYGTLKSEVERILNSGYNVIFDVDVKGGLNIKRLYKHHALSIFIMPPSEDELKNRLLKRGSETEANLKKRIDKAQLEIGFASQFDIVVVNKKLSKAIAEVEGAIRNFI